jgi:hypothetical protein
MNSRDDASSNAQIHGMRPNADRLCTYNCADFSAHCFGASSKSILALSLIGLDMKHRTSRRGALVRHAGTGHYIKSFRQQYSVRAGRSKLDAACFAGICIAATPRHAWLV